MWGAATGTSTRLRPRAVNWPAAIRALRDWQSNDLDPAQKAAVGRRQRDALRHDLQKDLAAYGLLEASTSATARLVDLLAPDARGVRQISVSGATREERETSFLVGITGAVGGSGVGVGDAIVRRATVATGRRILAESAVRDQIDDPSNSNITFSGDLFCLIYKLFLGDVVSSAIQTIIQEKIRLFFPILRLTDPIVPISSWIANEVTSLIPDPCAEAYDHGIEKPLVEIGHDLIAPSLLRALDLDAS